MGLPWSRSESGVFLRHPKHWHSDFVSDIFACDSDEAGKRSHTRSFADPQEVEGLNMPSFRKEPVKQTALQ